MRRTGFAMTAGLLLVLAGCGYFAKTNVGRAVQVAELEQRLVVRAASAVKAMCVAVPPSLDEPTCAKAKKLFETWRAGQIAAAEAIAAWKAVSAAGGSSDAALVAADVRVQGALARLGPLVKALLDFAGQFVNLDGLRRQISDLPPVSGEFLDTAAFAAR